MEISKLLEVLKLSDLEATDKDGNTALHLTVSNEVFTQKEMIDSLKILLNSGINPDIENEDNETVLQLAVVYRMKDVVDFLISCKSNMDSVAHFFIDNEYRRFLRLSTEEKISDEMASEIERIENESANYIEWLISKGFDFDCKAGEKQSPLIKAINLNLQHILPVLLKFTKNIDSEEGTKKTLLHSFLANNNSDPIFVSIAKTWYSDRYAADIVNIFLDRGVSVDAEDYDKSTPAQTAFRNGADIKVMKIFLEQSTKINHTNYEGVSLLEMVMQSFIFSNESEFEYHLKILRTIVAKGANVDVLNKYRNAQTFLCQALTQRNLRAIEFLQENGADFSVVTENCQNLLHLLVDRNLVVSGKKIDEDAEMILLDLLVSKGCQVNATDKGGYTPILLAVLHDNLAIVQKLVEHGADVNYKTHDGQSPLQVAAINRNLRIVEFLQEHGADLSVTTKYNENLLQLLAQKSVHKEFDDGDLEIIFLNLINNGCQVNCKDKFGNTPLGDAVTYDNVAMVQKLLEHGAEVNCKGNDGMTPLQIALAETHNVRVIELLKENRADFRVITKNHENLLHLLVKIPDALKPDDETEIKIIDLLISTGCKVNAKDAKGNTPLHDAVNRNKVAMIRKLIEHGAEVNCKTDNGETPLFIAAFKKYNLCLVELLRENGADVNATTKDGETLLHHLLKSSKELNISEEFQIQLFSAFVTEDCQMNVKDETGTSLIHVAVLNANVAMTRMLIQRGADVSCRNNKKETPLHLAMRIRSNAVAVAELLLEHGANVNAKDSQGQTALQKVANESNPDQTSNMIFSLLEHGADVNAKNANGITALNYARLRDTRDYENKRQEWIRNYYRRSDHEDEDYYGMSDYEDEDDYYPDERLTPENYHEQVKEWASWSVMVLTWHSIKLKAANLPWDRKIDDWLGDFEMITGSDNSRDEHYEDCLDEIEELKKTFIDKRVSLYSFLHMNPSRRCAYLNNEELQKLVQSPWELKEQFPEYFVLILATYRETKTRKSLLDSAGEAWQELTEIALPDLCLECIFSFLSNSDLFDMIEKD